MNRAVSTFKSSNAPHTRSSWTSIAFIVESILLLLCLVASLAVLTQVFSSSLNRSVESRTLDAATIAASSIAEHFAANPKDVQEEIQLGDLKITCSVTDEPRKAGTLYHARIEVFDVSESGGGKTVYTLETSRYQADEQANAARGAAGGAAESTTESAAESNATSQSADRNEHQAEEGGNAS